MGFAEFPQRGRESRFKDIKEDESESDDASGNILATFVSSFILLYFISF